MDTRPELQFDHERLEVYGIAVQFVALASRIYSDLPHGRSYLADQFKRAAASVVLNIAEGAGELHPDDKTRFYRYSCRSATECAAILDVCRALGSVDTTRLDEARDLLLRIVQMLIRLCKSRSRPGTGTGTGTGTGAKDALPGSSGAS
jgi:four helix bundle protein